MSHPFQKIRHARRSCVVKYSFAFEGVTRVGRIFSAHSQKKAKIYSTVPSAIGGTPMKKCAPYRLKAETDNPHYFTLDWIAWGLEINISLEHHTETCPWRVRFYKWQQMYCYLPHFYICCKLKEEVRKNLGATIPLYSEISNTYLYII